MAFCPVVTTGTFDGLHLGHVSVIKRASEVAASLKGTPLIFTFWPHPRQILGNDSFFLLNSLEEKRSLFEKLGVVNVFYQEFTPEFSELSSEEFFRRFIIEKFNAKALVVGFDHHFGKGRSGEFGTLGPLAREYNIDLYKVEQLVIDGVKVSSTKIRNSLLEGNVEAANKMLGYSYFLSGTVVRGRGIGQSLGFPTANITPGDALKCIPGNGIYFVYVEYEGVFYKGMLYIGYKPTINEKPVEKSIEVNILNFDKNIYGRELRIYFIRRLRDDLRFAGTAELIKQMEIDRQQTLSAGETGPLIPEKLM